MQVGGVPKVYESLYKLWRGDRHRHAWERISGRVPGIAECAAGGK